jgi:hypothetical protein
MVRPRRLSEAELAELAKPLPSVEELVAEAAAERASPSPPGGPAVVKMPEPVVPPWITGESAKPFIRKPGVGEMPPVPEVPARRLRVVAVDELREAFRALDPTPSEPEPVTHEFLFDAQLSGAVTVVEHGKARDPLTGEGVLGVFSAHGTSSMTIEGAGGDRRLVALERTATERLERVIPVPEREPPTLLVEVVRPDRAEPWRTVTDGASFSLAKVVSIELVDA